MELNGTGENCSLAMDMDKAYISNGRLMTLYKTLIELITQRKEQRGNDVAYVWYSKTMERTTLTYSEWYEKALAVASNLSSTIQKGDLVCLFCNNGKNSLIAFTALQILGAKTCTIAAERHLEGIIKLVKFKVVFLGKEYLTDNVRAMIKDADKTFLLDGESAEGHISFETLIENGDSDFVNNLPIVNPDDVTILLLSSGSTGTPKLICKDQSGVVHMSVGTYELVKSKNFFNDRTLAHVGGLFSIFNSALGQTIVATTKPMAQGSEHITQICQKEKIEAGFFVQYFFYDLIKRRKEVIECLGDLKVILTGGQLPVKSVVKQFAQLLPKVPIIDIYGSTEVGCIFMKSLENLNFFSPFDSQEISIRDKNGRILKRNETGEIWVRQHCGFHGYYAKNPIVASAWQNMSDLGYITTKGCLHVQGRTTDMLHIGMLKVNPFIYEEKIEQLSEVEKAVIVGIPDERLGETMCAVVKFTKEYLEKTNVEEAKEFLTKWSSENLHGNENLGLVVKIEKVHIMKGDWPRSDLGKLKRKDIQQLAVEKLRKAEF